ncbi:MAG: molecular chaperone DnaJ [Proteobacteria bacterium]|nr:molecular chaperone DnaJ [Pseudomonadota bacterium]
MIFRLLALIALPIMAYYLAKTGSQRLNLSPRQSRILFIIVAALLVVGLLVAIGRLPVHFILAPLGAAAAFLLRMLPTFLRLLPMWHMFKGRVASARPREKGQTSTIRTEYLAMELEHDSGKMDGQVLKGAFANKRMADLSLDDLLALYSECSGDGDSSQVLEAYIDRQHPDWREKINQSARRQATADDSVMTRELAIEILGLAEPTNKKDIVKAHRQLMQGLHPDRGGSDYLAKKINAAKDFLLKKP